MSTRSSWRSRASLARQPSRYPCRGLPRAFTGAAIWHGCPLTEPERTRDLDEFLERVADKLHGMRPVNVRDATRAVFRTLSRHVDPGQSAKVIDALPEKVRAFWAGALEANDAAAAPGRQAG